MFVSHELLRDDQNAVDLLNVWWHKVN